MHRGKIMKHLFYKIPAAVFTIFLLTINFFAQTEREKGIEFYEAGNYKTAIESLQKAVETNENDGEAWRFLAMAFARESNTEQALKAFDKAAEFRDEDLNKKYDLPVKFINLPKNNYTKEARRNNVTGRVKLAVEFGKDGQIKHIFSIRELPDGLTEKAVEAAHKIKFKPAIINGKPVTVIKFVEYSFTIF